MHRFRSGFLALCLVATACTTNPATGKREITFMSTEREAEIGREASAQVAQEMGIVDDPELAAYVSKVGERVARQSPRQDVPYSFQIVDMAEPNAFALPGGYIYVSRGLLVITNSEDELANVIGHEIGHVAARHAAQREAAAVPVGILTALGSIAAGLIGGGQAAQAVGNLGQTASAGMIASYGRDQEREADHFGQDYASKAGADPAAMAGFLGTLEKATALEHADARQPSFLDSHPSTPERVAAAASNAQALAFQPQPGVARNHDDFLRKLDGLVVGQNAEEGVVEGSRLLHPGLGFQIRYPEGWKIANGRSAVLATAPNRDAVLVLELERQARSPREAAALFTRQNNLQVVEAGAVQLAQGSGFRALVAMPTQRGPMAVDLTWVPYDGRVYRLTGLSNSSDYRAYQGAFASVARSFRGLTPEELRGIREQHLRIVPAQEGESLGQLLARNHSSWKLDEAAVANALAPNARLRAGQLVKVAIGEPYSGRTTAVHPPPSAPPPTRQAPAPPATRQAPAQPPPRPANPELEPL
jgi:predicted Zn-dependent protease